MTCALQLIKSAISDLESKLQIPAAAKHPSLAVNRESTSLKGEKSHGENQQKKKRNVKNESLPAKNTPSNHHSQPDICKLEFKVGQITNVWIHPDADKLYCEEIECGEDKPRQVASGLRHHYSLDEMQGRRLLLVSNLKTKKLAGFPSSGMVLCAAKIQPDDTEKVEFVEPPKEAVVGEIIKFEGLPTPEPLSSSQVEKKKIFHACVEGMKTNEVGLAVWNGHTFMTSVGPCKAPSIMNGVMR